MTETAPGLDTAGVDIDVERLTTLGLVSAALSHQIANALAVFQFAIDELVDAAAEHRAPSAETVALLATGRDRLLAQTGTALRLAGQVARAPARHELGELVRELTDGLRRAGVTRHATLDVTIAGGELAVVASRGELDQLVLGLVAAAADAVAERGTAGRIAIDVRRSSDAVVVEVRDNGASLPHGLGVAIAKRLVAALDGTFEVTHTSAGSVATIALPTAPALSGRRSQRSGLRYSVQLPEKYP